MEEKVSIIMPSYNSGRFIGKSIQSVIDQTYKNWELVIVDDCSKDNTEEVIKGYHLNENRIIYFRLEKNSGAAAARNKSLELASGRFIAFLDSDDVWKNNKLEKQIKIMQDNDYAFTFSSYEFMDEQGNKLNKIVKVPDRISYREYLKNTIIGCLTVVVDTDKTGKFTMVDIKRNQDMATWLKLIKICKYAYGINQNLASYRIVNGSITSSKKNAAKSVWNTYRNVEKLSILYSTYCFIMYAFNGIKKRI